MKMKRIEVTIHNEALKVMRQAQFYISTLDKIYEDDEQCACYYKALEIMGKCIEILKITVWNNGSKISDPTLQILEQKTQSLFTENQYFYQS